MRTYTVTDEQVKKLQEVLDCIGGSRAVQIRQILPQLFPTRRKDILPGQFYQFGNEARMALQRNADVHKGMWTSVGRSGDVMHMGDGDTPVVRVEGWVKC